MRGDGGVAGEGRLVGVPKFHSWVSSPCQISAWIGCPTLPLACVLHVLDYLLRSFNSHLGVNYMCVEDQEY